MLVFIARRGACLTTIQGMVSASQTVCTKQDYETGELVSGLAGDLQRRAKPRALETEGFVASAKPSLPASRRHGP